jgi:hypothetical protein
LLLLGGGCLRSQNDLPKDTSSASSSSTEARDGLGYMNSGPVRTHADETDGWLSFVDTSAGLLVAYPPDIDFASNEFGATYRLDVEVKPVFGLSAPLGYDEETARENAIALMYGKYGQSVDFSLTASERVRDISGTGAQDFLVLSRFEVCDVIFERKLYFVYNEHLIVLTLSADVESVLPSVLEYLATDMENCGERPMWIFDLQSKLFEVLEAGTAPTPVQRWYDLFDQIAGTIVLSSLAMDDGAMTLDGLWRAVADDKSLIEFRGDRKLDYYDGMRVSEARYELDGNRLTVTEGDDLFEYDIMELNEKSLLMFHLPRGNVLEYVRP